MTTGIEEISKQIACLTQNFPNPGKENTTITCFVPEESRSSVIRIFDISGYMVKEIAVSNCGTNEIYVNLSDFKDGIYFYSLVVDGQIIDTKRMAVSN